MGVLWHVVIGVSLCTCVYSAGLFSFCLMFDGEKFSKSHEAGCWNLILKFCLGFSLHYNLRRFWLFISEFRSEKFSVAVLYHLYLQFVQVGCKDFVPCAGVWGARRNFE